MRIDATLEVLSEIQQLLWTFKDPQRQLRIVRILRVYLDMFEDRIKDHIRFQELREDIDLD
jgi:hypothetical protein